MGLRRGILFSEWVGVCQNYRKWWISEIFNHKLLKIVMDDIECWFWSKVLATDDHHFGMKNKLVAIAVQSWGIIVRGTDFAQICGNYDLWHFPYMYKLRGRVNILDMKSIFKGKICIIIVTSKEWGGIYQINVKIGLHFSDFFVFTSRQRTAHPIRV